MARDNRDDSSHLCERDARLSAAFVLACEELTAAGERGKEGWFAPYNFERTPPLDIQALLETITETGDEELLAALVQGAGGCVAALAVWCLLEMSSAVFPSKDFMRLSLSSKEENSERRFTALRRVLSPQGEVFSGGADPEQRRRDRHLFASLVAAAAGTRPLLVGRHQDTHTSVGSRPALLSPIPASMQRPPPHPPFFISCQYAAPAQ